MWKRVWASQRCKAKKELLALKLKLYAKINFFIPRGFGDVSRVSAFSPNEKCFHFFALFFRFTPFFYSSHICERLLVGHLACEFAKCASFECQLCTHYATHTAFMLALYFGVGTCMCARLNCNVPNAFGASKIKHFFNAIKMFLYYLLTHHLH